MSFHAGQTFTFGETPSATKWNYLWENDYALADGTGISDNAIINRHIGDEAVDLAELKKVTKYVSFGYSKTAMNDGSTITGIPLCVVKVPNDYVSGTDIVLKCTSRNTSGSGVVVRRLDVYRFRDATALSAQVSAANVNRTVSSTNVVFSTLQTLAAANWQAGDGLGATLNRVGADGADTNTGIEDCDGMWIEYTGRA